MQTQVELAPITAFIFVPGFLRMSYAKKSQKNNTISGNSKSRLEVIIENGRRGSTALINTIRRGSLPSWAGGPPSNLQQNDDDIITDAEADTDDPLDSHYDEEVAPSPLRIPMIQLNGQAGSTPLQNQKPTAPDGSPLVPDSQQQRHPIKIIKHRHSHSEEKREAVKLAKVRGNVNMGLILSALYAKLLVVMGIAFPLSEVISTYIPQKYYDGFYLYLYCGSMLFMLGIFGAVIKRKVQRSTRGLVERVSTFKFKPKMSNSTDSGVAPDVVSGEDDGHQSNDEDEEAHRRCHSLSERRLRRRAERHNFGSFYLRMGAMAFGTGSVIYSGLEFGQYFELDEATKCHNYMVALTPLARMTFTFMQMYFIFLNSQMAVGKTSLTVQFGLMHMIGTNLCVWLNVLVEETKHEILHFYDPTNGTVSLNKHHGSSSGSGHGKHSHSSLVLHDQPSSASSEDSEILDMLNNSSTEAHHHHLVRRGLKSMYDCRRVNIMGSLVDNASPFLFPCTIEYSLICAAVCYVMWKSTAKRRVARLSRYIKNTVLEATHFNRSHHQYTVDCSSANKGLFLGIFVLVITIMSLIINLVLKSQPDYMEVAILEVNIIESVVYISTSAAVLLGMCQVRELRYDSKKNLELDSILLIVAQSGSMIYCVFTIVGGQFVAETTNKLVLLNAIASLIQILLQTIFIIDASKRVPATREQIKRKPGREVVTFLLVCNLAMWLINTLENSRGDSHPVQLQFYGIWAWTIITDISMPLAIFYRFHSTVCLCEVWKKAYKLPHSESRSGGTALRSLM